MLVIVGAAAAAAAQVSTDCSDCAYIEKRHVCYGAQFDNCPDSGITVGGSCLALCAAACEDVVARIVADRLSLPLPNLL